AQLYDDGTRSEPWLDRPWKDKREIAASETLRLMAIPASEIEQIRPPVPLMLFPPGELGFVNEPLTIEEVLDTGRWDPQIRSWLSPTVMPRTRQDFQDDAWSGTQRGVSQSVNPML
ncbi:MAG: hypothetical protein WBW27_27050, partial [Pseudolabrys sp.]